MCRAKAPSLDQFARDNAHRIEVVGVGTQDDLDYARRFVDDTGITFTMLWSDSAEAWHHYGVYSNSDFWLIDSVGDRVGDSPRPYDGALVEQLLNDLAGDSRAS